MNEQISKKINNKNRLKFFNNLIRRFYPYINNFIDILSSYYKKLKLIVQTIVSEYIFN